MIKYIKLIILTLIIFLLNNCDNLQKNHPTSSKKIIIGTSVGDFSDMVKDKIKPILEKKGYKIKLIEFTDYIKPNIALDEKSIDINIFQHKPYLEEFIKKNNIKNELIAVFQVPTASLGIYSARLLSLKDIHQNINLSIPNDTTNLSRSLLLIENLNWIKLKKTNKDRLYTIHDIVKNPYNIKFIELEAAQLPRSKKDVDYVIINGNYAESAGIKIDSALFKENNLSYINWAVIRKKDYNQTWVKDITNAYNSDEFKKYAYEKFKGYYFPNSWNGDK